MKKKLVVIGAGPAGLPVASQVRKETDQFDINVITDRHYFSYSPCGIPFVFSGVIKSFDNLIMRSNKHYEDMNIFIHTNTRVTEIDTEKQIVVTNKGNFPYDVLVIATGVKPFVPPIRGIDLEGVHFMYTLEEAIEVERSLKNSCSVAIVGGGAIGLEMAYAFRKRNKDVLVIEKGQQIMPSILDPDMSAIVEDYLVSNGINILKDTEVTAFEGDDGKVTTIVTKDGKINIDMVLVSVGVRPNVEMAVNSGIERGVTGGLITDSSLRVRKNGRFLPNVYACGNCIEIIDGVTFRPALSALGSTAVRQALTVAENILGSNTVFTPIVSPGVSIIGDLEIGVVGVNSKRAIENGIVPRESQAKGLTRARYFPKGEIITVKILVDKNYRLIGSQIISKEGVKGRIDSMSFMISKGITAHQLALIETSYVPPISSVIDPLTIAARKLIGITRDRFTLPESLDNST
ncbi:MAG: FAD-dependent oxidoreductase [Candidatus Methanofastidiosa archaeon]|nr:FAD-dependent oxidoreductase [Candidatus Methanofastidiosa archaeon]